MILFLSSWHILIVIGVFLGCSAFLCAGGLLWLLSRAYKGAVQDVSEMVGQSQARRERRSAAARKGHETRRAKLPIVVKPTIATTPEYKIEITPDDALGFIRGEEQS